MNFGNYNSYIQHIIIGIEQFNTQIDMQTRFDIGVPHTLDYIFGLDQSLKELINS